MNPSPMSVRKRAPSGPGASKPGEVVSECDSMDREKTFEELLAWIFDDAREGLRDELSPSDYEKLRRDFVFHMTDWSSDLRRMAALFEVPGLIQKREASRFVIEFLYHVIPHLKAAGRLLLDDVGDP